MLENKFEGLAWGERGNKRSHRENQVYTGRVTD